MKSKQRRMDELDMKIQELEQRRQLLRTQCCQELSQLIQQAEADALPKDVLIGAVLYATNQYERRADIVDQWRQEGSSFLRRVGKQKSRTKSTVSKPDSENKSTASETSSNEPARPEASHG